MAYVTDSSSFARKGRLLAAPELVASPWGGFGNALRFHGRNSQNNSQGVNFGAGLTRTGDFTVEANFRLTALPTGSTIAAVLCGVYDSASIDYRNYLLRIINDGSVRLYGTVFDSDGNGQNLIGAVLLSGVIYDAALVRTGTQMRLYLDGVLQTTLTVTTLKIPNAASEFWIGRESRNFNTLPAQPWPYPLNGDIDEVRVSDIARYTGPTYTPGPHTPDANTLLLAHLDSIVSEATSEPVGKVSFFDRLMPPEGWLFADGSLCHPTSFPELFEHIGTRYGGDGVTTFQLRDMGDRFIKGKLPSETLGALGGAATHGHGGPDDLETVVQNATGLVGPVFVDVASQTHQHGTANHLPPNVALLPCIRYEPGEGGSGMADWTEDEKKQIRKALGITGDTAVTTGAGVLDEVKTDTTEILQEVADTKNVALNQNAS